MKSLKISAGLPHKTIEIQSRTVEQRLGITVSLSRLSLGVNCTFRGRIEIPKSSELYNKTIAWHTRSSGWCQVSSSDPSGYYENVNLRGIVQSIPCHVPDHCSLAGLSIYGLRKDDVRWSTVFSQSIRDYTKAPITQIECFEFEAYKEHRCLRINLDIEFFAPETIAVFASPAQPQRVRIIRLFEVWGDLHYQKVLRGLGIQSQQDQSISSSLGGLAKTGILRKGITDRFIGSMWHIADRDLMAAELDRYGFKLLAPDQAEFFKSQAKNYAQQYGGRQ